MNHMRRGTVVVFLVLAANVARADRQSPTPSSMRTFVSPAGVTMKVITDANDVRGDEVEIVELTFPPNSDSGDHRHAVTETFYLLEGAMEQVINGTPVKLIPGSAVSLRSTDTVRHKSGPSGARVLVVWAPGGEIARVVSRWKPQ
jgi:quercetin dioxygenase-like cupin family protein